MLSFSVFNTFSTTYTRHFCVKYDEKNVHTRHANRYFVVAHGDLFFGISKTHMLASLTLNVTLQERTIYWVNLS